MHLKFNKSFHFIVIFIIFSIFTNETLSVDPNFEACMPRNCGNGPNISYPFWIANLHESYCGQPNFEVTCNGGNPVVAISDDDYVIQEIFDTNNSFLLTNSMVYDFENTCPIPLHNFSTEGTPYNYSHSYVDLFFFYNCSTYPIKEPTYRVVCASNATDLSFAVFQKEVLEYENYSIDSCNSWVNAPVESGDIKKLLEMNFTDVLRRGFVLEWSEDYCSDCKRSEGNCGSINNKFTCFCSDKQHSKTCDDGHMKWTTKLGIVIPMVGATILCAFLIFWFRKKTSTYKSIFFWRKSTMEDDNVEAFLKINGSLVPQRYSYSRIKKVTNSFQDKLGKGGYGDVYKGKLLDGRLVAVKLLNETKGSNGEEFINEVASISRTSHVNIVSLVGYCFEGRKRALIYEYMPNGSLEKFIHNNKSQETNDNLEWKTMHKIALGVARGLEYLHRGCTTRIFHFDIKPHNILLDEDFCPKISDFGLAKLCPKKESIVSMLHARGTIGYIAPEVFSRNFGRVSHKADVYSYGMLVLEMVRGRENIEQSIEDTSDLYFPHSIYKKLECDGDIGLHGIESEEDEKLARKMILVGLCCIQANPSDRPTTNKVIEMLEGNLESLPVPPEPFLSSPSRTPIASSIIQIS